jgi:2-(1,2-epoxy-1,2-dihydrophenyl)acetyl-CoA isomerase
MTKLLIQAASSQSLDTHLDLEREYQQRAGRSADYVEGVAAFLQKRNPEFKGQ